MAQVILQNGAAPSTPAAGNVAVYSKTDKLLYAKDDAGVETQLGGGSVTTASQKLPTIGCTQAGGALTFTASSQYLDFRSTTLTSGTISTVLAAPTSLVLPSGGTLGFVTTVSGAIIVLEINNAGTAELAIVNQSGGIDLSETGVISTTAISAASTSSTVVYSTSARTNVAYRIVGVVYAVNTAGTWGNPTLIQGAGGNSLINMQSSSMVRLNTANGYGSTNTKIRRFTNVVTNQGTDITYADSATLGASFTINTNGVYAISYSNCGAVAMDFGVSINTTTPTTGIQSVTATEVLALATTPAANLGGCASGSWYLAAGAVIRPHTDGNSSGTRTDQFTITRVK